jgi:hypothetical protein
MASVEEGFARVLLGRHRNDFIVYASAISIINATRVMIHVTLITPETAHILGNMQPNDVKHTGNLTLPGTYSVVCVEVGGKRTEVFSPIIYTEGAVQTVTRVMF